MTLQTVWHDNGVVKCVDSSDSPAVVHGAEKATVDTDVVGEITLRHTVTVKNGEVTSAEYQAPPPPTAEEWYSMISQRADTELQRGVSVTIDGTTYGIRTGPQALALIDGAAIRADVAARNNESVSRRVPTDQGIVSFDGPALWSIFEAVEGHQQAVAERAEALEAMVADGSITPDELDKGWP